MYAGAYEPPEDDVCYTFFLMTSLPLSIQEDELESELMTRRITQFLPRSLNSSISTHPSILLCFTKSFSCMRVRAYVCMCVCAYVCMCVCVYVHMRLGVLTREDLTHSKTHSIAVCSSGAHIWAAKIESFSSHSPVHFITATFTHCHTHALHRLATTCAVSYSMHCKEQHNSTTATHIQPTACVVRSSYGTCIYNIPL